MKIIWVDNYARETISERVVANNIKSEVEAKQMLEGLQQHCTSEGPNWYKLAADDYVPYRFEP